MKIRYLGHACFQIIAEDNTRIITDPYRPMGIKMPAVEADIVTSSHGHYDHNYFKGVKGNFVAIDDARPVQVKGVNISGIELFHDNEGGKRRGKTIAFVIKTDGLTLCHLGDLGHTLSAAQVDAIGHVDILLVPVGGFFTIGPEDAARVTKAIAPKIAIPMHYKPKLPPNVSFELPIQDADPFMKLMNGTRSNDSVLTIDKDHLPDSLMVIELLSAAEF